MFLETHEPNDAQLEQIHRQILKTQTIAGKHYMVARASSQYYRRSNSSAVRSQMDRRALPSTLSPCFAVDNNLLANIYIHTYKYQSAIALMKQTSFIIISFYQGKQLSNFYRYTGKNWTVASPYGKGPDKKKWFLSLFIY